MVNVNVRHVNVCKELQIEDFWGFGKLCFVRGEWAVGFLGVASWPPEANMAGLRSRRPAGLRASKPLNVKKSFRSVFRWPTVPVDRPGGTGGTGGWAGRQSAGPRAGRRAGWVGPWALGSTSRHDVDLDTDITI